MASRVTSALKKKDGQGFKPSGGRPERRRSSVVYIRLFGMTSRVGWHRGLGNSFSGLADGPLMGSEVTVMDPGSTWKTAWRLRLTVRPCFGRQVSFLFAFDSPAGSVAGRDRGVGGSTPARVVSAPGSRRGFLPVPGLAGGDRHGPSGLLRLPAARGASLASGLLPWPLGWSRTGRSGHRTPILLLFCWTVKQGTVL